MANFPGLDIVISFGLGAYVSPVGFDIYPILGGGGNTAPAVSYVTPGGTITASSPIIVDVVDVDSPAPSTFLFARFAASGGVEVVWDGSAFAPFYGSSTRVPIVNGHRYTLIRSGAGWPSDAITINANAIDDAGGIAT